MAVNLEESPGADSVGGRVGLVDKFSRPRRSHLFWLGSPGRSGWPCLEHYDAGDFRQGSRQSVCPFSNWSTRSSRFAESLDQELSVVCIGKKLNLVNSVGHGASAPHLPEGRNGAINQRGTYRTLLNWKQFV